MSPRNKNLPSLRQWSALAAMVFAAGRAAANPAGMTVAAGSATAVQNGSQLNITASHNAVINWQSFNIAANETTTFQQPNNISVVWNRIADANPSQIWGHLNANGIVVLMNQNGFYFGPNSSVNVGGFVAAGAWVTPPASAGGAMWTYQGPPPAASIINYGEIKANNGGSLFLVAEKIENHGVLTAPDGTLGLYAGKQVLLSERPDGRGLSANVALPDGAIDNVGKISADAGTIALHAQVVNQDGIIQANSVRDNHGVIELVASDAVNLGANSLIQANGDASGASAGGQITIKSANTFADDPASRIEVRGGANGGNGGAVEISAATMSAVNSKVDGSAVAGFTGGKLLVDPTDLTLNSSSLAPYFGFSQIAFTATHNISLAANATLDLSGSTGVSTPGSLLTLEAGNNIIFGNGSLIEAGAGWSVALYAGVNFNLSTSANIVTTPGTGGIYLNGGVPTASSENGGTPSINLSGAIEAFDGNITLNAGHEVIVGSGYVRTVGGGNISVVTGDGNVLAGTDNNTYDYIKNTSDPTQPGYSVSSKGLGGIGTADGGDVTVAAGQDIISTKANIGAFGVNPGDVTLTAARDIFGKFMLRDGAGVLNAGRDVGTSGSQGQAWFGLVGGGWTVNAGRDIYVNEVYNPNGTFNSQANVVPDGIYPGNMVVDSSGLYYVSQSPPATSSYLFDYSPTAYATFNAGNSVQLLDGTTLNGSTPVFAPILNMFAGAGGVVLNRNLILYPSAYGSLDITTTAGGSLRATGNDTTGYNYFTITESDNGMPGRTGLLKNQHAVLPVHAAGLGNGVNLDISGDVKNVELILAQAADIHIHGNAENFAFNGQNTSVNDVTRLRVDGDFITHNDYNSVTLANAANFDAIFSGNPVTLADGTMVVASTDGQILSSSLSYDATTGKLTFKGIMTAAQLNFLENPVVCLYDPLTEMPKTDASGNQLAPISVGFTTDTASLAGLKAATVQNVPIGSKALDGLQLNGPGRFQISAHTFDLSTSSGIRASGPLNPALAAVSLQSADIRLDLSGDLDMTSSQIATFNNSSITIHADGNLNVGSQDSTSSDDTPKGIYTGHGGDVNIRAGGDINVDGSRIASYDGGDVTVVSDTGTVNAGSGAKGFFGVSTIQFDPTTGRLVNKNDRFFGSGIMALTAVNSQARVGDITVKAGGDILAGSGGVLQIAFNSADQTGAKVSLDAGGSILASQSGILGRNVDLTAKGDITGIIVAAQNLAVAAQQNVSVTALAGGSANVSGGGTVSGSIVGGGNVSVGGGEVTAAAISTGGAVSGGTSGATSAFAGVAAPTAQKTTDDADKTVASSAATAQTSDEDELKKRGAGKSPVLAQKVSRVTVILPKKS